MHWYNKTHEVDGVKITVHGSFKDSEVQIDAIIDWPDDLEYIKLYQKEINMWKHQDVLAEDILAKYEGQIKKYESRLSGLIEKAKLRRRI